MGHNNEATSTTRHHFLHLERYTGARDASRAPRYVFFSHFFNTLLSTGRLRATTTFNGHQQPSQRTMTTTKYRARDGLNVEAGSDKKGPNDVFRVIWALGEYIFFILRVYFILTKPFCLNLDVNNFIHNVVPSDDKTGPNDTKRIVWA